jgi:hypothetical protein
MEDPMPAELPIACSLSATELPVRQAQMAALGHDALTHASVDGTHAELRFAAGAGVRDRVEDVVVAEAGCCAFLSMRVSDAPDTVVLSIQAPEGAELVLRELVRSFSAEPHAAG